jgi:beta-barrel assembly-enhancing protease
MSRCVWVVKPLRQSLSHGVINIVAITVQAFEAHAFPADPGQDAIEGTVCFSWRSLVFSAGETVIEIPSSQLAAEFENVGDGRLIFRNRSQDDWTIVTSDFSVLELPSIPYLVELAARVQSQLVRRELWRRVRIALFFFAGCGVALALGMLAVGAMVRSIVTRIPPQFEADFGQQALKELKDDFQVVDEPQRVAALAATAKPLLDTLPGEHEWHFYIVKTESLNAFALPGGHILVTSGLLERVERPEELLGIVAHEVAHVTKRHSFRRQISSVGPFLVFQVFIRGRSGLAAVVGGGSALLVEQSFSQEYEKEADDVGWDYLVAANIDPRGMTSVFRKLQTAEAAEAGHAGVALLPKAFQSHPDVSKRIARLQAKWNRLPQKSGFLELQTNAPLRR